MSSWSYRPSLDGLRMLSMYLIVLFHAGVTWTRGAFVAVDLFFILSGYLVTNVILSEIDRTGKLDLRNFYARRVRRLLPAALVAIIGTSFVFLLVASAVRRAAIIGDAQAALVYVANWRFISQSNDYFAADNEASPFLHFWTLGIEEQFYVFFPLLLILLVKSRHKWMLLAGLSALFLASFGSQIYWGIVDPIHAYYGTDARLYQLVAGALLAVAFRTWQPKVSDRTASGMAVGGLVLFVLLSGNWIGVSQSARGMIATVAILAMIAGLMLAEKQLLGRLLARRTPVYLGQITYATYLWHWPILLVLREVMEVRPELMSILVAILATAMAAASNELLELPIRKSKRLNRFGWPVVASGLAASVATALVIVPPVLKSERTPVLTAAAGSGAGTEVASALAGGGSGRGSGVKLEPPPKDVDWDKVRQDNGHPVNCTKNNIEQCVAVDGDGLHVLLVGDSHAQMMSEAFTELAKEKKFKLSMNVVSECAWQEGLLSNRFTGELQETCANSRVDWYDDVLPDLEPDVVVLTGRARDSGRWNRLIERRDGKDQPLEKATLETSRDTLKKIRKVKARALLVEQLAVPDNQFDPNECLATARNSIDCAVAVPNGSTLTDSIYQTIAIETDGVDTVDLNRALCPDAPLCAPVKDGEPVYRDHSHFRASYVAKQRERVWKALERTGAITRS